MKIISVSKRDIACYVSEKKKDTQEYIDTDINSRYVKKLFEIFTMATEENLSQEMNPSNSVSK